LQTSSEKTGSIVDVIKADWLQVV